MSDVDKIMKLCSEFNASFASNTKQKKNSCVSPKKETDKVSPKGGDPELKETPTVTPKKGRDMVSPKKETQKKTPIGGNPELEETDMVSPKKETQKKTPIGGNPELVETDMVSPKKEPQKKTLMGGDPELEKTPTATPTKTSNYSTTAIIGIVFIFIASTAIYMIDQNIFDFSWFSVYGSSFVCGKMSKPSGGNENMNSFHSSSNSDDFKQVRDSLQSLREELKQAQVEFDAKLSALTNDFVLSTGFETRLSALNSTFYAVVSDLNPSISTTYLNSSDRG